MGNRLRVKKKKRRQEQAATHQVMLQNPTSLPIEERVHKVALKRSRKARLKKAFRLS